MSRIPRWPGEQAIRPLGRPVLAIAEGVIAASEKWLRAGRIRPTEKIVYWAGVKRADVSSALTVIRPAARLTFGSFRITPEANAEVVACLADRGLALVAQVHTHPGDWVDHSAGDDEDAFMPTENYISIVVPHYCRGGVLPLSRCGVHRYEGGGFRRLGGDELRASLCVIAATEDLSR